MSTRIQYRRGTAAQWTSANPVLSLGEPGYETDTGYEKIGDGATAWATLAYRIGPLNQPSGVARLGSDGTVGGSGGSALVGSAGSAASPFAHGYIIDLNAAPYSVSPGQDITSALNTALAALLASGYPTGEILLDPASASNPYLINGASQTGTYNSGGATYNYAGQVLFPACTMANAMNIRIRGKTTHNDGMGSGGAYGPANGCVLLSNATSGYVFDFIPGSTVNSKAWTGIAPTFQDLVIRVPNNPTCGGINAFTAIRAKLRDMTIDVPSTYTQPTSGSLMGFVPPQVGNGGVFYRGVHIYGFPVGLGISEHAVGDVGIYGCAIAIQTISGGGHLNTLTLDIEECGTLFSSTSTNSAHLMAVLDIENTITGANVLAPVAFVNEAISGAFGGKILLSSQLANGQGMIGGKNLDVEQIGSQAYNNNSYAVSRASRGGWRGTHPRDNFRRAVDPMTVATPGQCWPSLHPWHVNAAAGPVTVSGQQMWLASGANAICSLPALDGVVGGVSRTITATIVLAASANINIFACVPTDASANCQAATKGITFQFWSSGVTPYLKVNNTTVVTGANVAANATHTVQMKILYVAGAPYLVTVLIDGVKTHSYTLTAAQQAAMAPASVCQPPYIEDGILFGEYTSKVSSFQVTDAIPDPPYVASGTAVLVAGTVTVANTNITTTSRIRYWVDTVGGTPGDLSLTRSAATSFTLTSSSNTETSTIYYEIVSY